MSPRCLSLSNLTQCCVQLILCTTSCPSHVYIYLHIRRPQTRCYVLYLYTYSLLIRDTTSCVSTNYSCSYEMLRNVSLTRTSGSYEMRRHRFLYVQYLCSYEMLHHASLYTNFVLPSPGRLDMVTPEPLIGVSLAGNNSESRVGGVGGGEGEGGTYSSLQREVRRVRAVRCVGCWRQCFIDRSLPISQFGPQDLFTMLFSAQGVIYPKNWGCREQLLFFSRLDETLKGL